MTTPFAIGLDFGTNSVRALVVDAKTGAELASHVVDYPSGRQGVLLDARNHQLARQNPADYFFGLEKSVRGAIRAAKKERGFDPKKVVGLGVDTTGSSPLPVDKTNRPLGTHARWRGNLAAQCWLWKDHTSHREAAEITRLAAQHRPQYIAKCGKVYSSEWFWSKIWKCLKTVPAVFDAAESWVELSDYLPSVLAGVTNPRQIKRGVCAAGHKALYSDEWGGLPDKGFLKMLDPRLAALRDRLYEQACDASESAGSLCAEWAKKLGLPAGIPIAIGAMDVHYGAIGSGVEEGTLIKVIGTSTCDCGVVSVERQMPDIPGICGIVKGSILPGYYGLEAGQSAVGDIFKWWIEVVCEGDARTHGQFTAKAAKLKPGQSGLLALDWNNGNRTVLVDQLLTGLLVGQTLYTTPWEIYRALIEATAFGARAIIERLREYGVPINRIVCAGGVAEKNPLLMQIYADVTGCEMRVAGSTQACALGGAIAAAVLAGVHPNFAAAKDKMTSLNPKRYRPDAARQKTYEKLYALYRVVHDAFGGVKKDADLSDVMKGLIRVKEEANR